MNQTIKNIQRGEVYYTSFDNAVGSEICGTHPLVVLQNNTGNYHSTTTIGAVLSTRLKKPLMPTHIAITCGDLAGSMVMTEQIFTVDKQRLHKFLGILDESMMEKIESAVCASLGMAAPNEMRICLCSRCLKSFRAVPGHPIRRVDHFQVQKDICCYCGQALGFDYFVPTQYITKL